MNDKEALNIKSLFAKLWRARKLYYKVLPIVLVIAALWIFVQPRYYKCTIQLAPETASESAMGGLSSIASSFGFNLGGINSVDAIYPMIYPNVVSSSDFLVDLFNIEIKTQDGDIKTTYYKYLKEHQKISIWSVPFIAMRKVIKNILPANNVHNLNKKDGEFDSFWLSTDENAILGKVSENVKCEVDQEFQIVSITVTDQDRLVCATIADSVMARLQKYITEYRTSKYKNDLTYYTKLTEEARLQYDKACEDYSKYADSHLNVSMKRASTDIMKLENRMQQAYTTYNAFLMQMQTASAKVQEKTPAFTIIQGASVPEKPAGPKRMLFCLGMMVLAVIGVSGYLLRKDIFS